MKSNYDKIIRDNLENLYRDNLEAIATRLPARREAENFLFTAFGDSCEVSPAGIRLGRKVIDDPRGIIISLYARFASDQPCLMDPFRAYREFENTMPYAGAFHTHTEQLLVPHADRIIEKQADITAGLDGGEAPAGIGGDCAFTVRPLPKIVLAYIIYEADDDFPASVTCLYSANADAFLPPDALADVGEYTSRKIIARVNTL